MIPKLLSLSVIMTLLWIPNGRAAEPGLIADFNSGEAVNVLGKGVEVWLRGDGSDTTQSCALSVVSDDALGDPQGKALRLDYDVDSENPAYNGVRTDIKGFDASAYKTLNFYIKGDAAAGFGKNLKIEMIGQTQRPSPFIVTGITDSWQKISVPLDQFFAVRDWATVEKFVIVFADITNDPKVGTVYIDQIYFSA